MNLVGEKGRGRKQLLFGGGTQRRLLQLAKELKNTEASSHTQPMSTAFSVLGKQEPGPGIEPRF